MPAPDSTAKAGADKTDEKGDGAVTTSTSATDASTTEGRTAALGTDKPAADPQRVVIEQAPAEPAVYYGEDAEQPAPREHVKANYQSFEW